MRPTKPLVALFVLYLFLAVAPTQRSQGSWSDSTPTAVIAAEKNFILISVIQSNAEVLEYIKTVKKENIDRIPLKRAEEIRDILYKQSLENKQFFYSAWLPILWNGSGFINSTNDKTLRRKLWSIGYAELQVRTAREMAKRKKLTTFDTMTDDQVREELILNWKLNLDLGHLYASSLWKKYWDANKVMNAYQTGEFGMDSGKWTITTRIKGLSFYCQRQYKGFVELETTLRKPN